MDKDQGTWPCQIVLLTATGDLALTMGAALIHLPIKEAAPAGHPAAA